MNTSDVLYIKTSDNKPVGDLARQINASRFDLEDGISNVHPLNGGGTQYSEDMIRQYRGHLIDAKVVRRKDVIEKPLNWSFMSDKAYVVDRNGALLSSLDLWRLKKISKDRYPVKIGDRVLAYVKPINRNSALGHDVIVYPWIQECVDLAPHIGGPFIQFRVGGHSWLRGDSESGILSNCVITQPDTDPGKMEEISVAAPDGPVFAMTSRNRAKFNTLKRLLGASATITYKFDPDAMNYLVSILSEALK